MLIADANSICSLYFNVEIDKFVMIEYLKGGLVELQPTVAIIECAGVGYEVNISLNTYSAVQGKKDCKLYIYEVIREDTHQLYGFYSREERSLFLLLNSVKGVGGNTARMILSSLSPRELIDVLITENASLLKTVKGIGLKTAQRIIVELKDKAAGLDAGAAGSKKSSGDDGSPIVIQYQVQQEAVAALTMLGFQPAASSKVVNALLQEHGEAPVEQIIKLALKRL